jgi:hypothetical protein
MMIIIVHSRDSRESDALYSTITAQQRPTWNYSEKKKANNEISGGVGSLMVDAEL